MTNVSSPAAAAATGFLNMSNVIDSLKRLERIGSEESETVRKILEAAKELSRSICQGFPANLRDQQIKGYVDRGNTIRLGYPDFDGDGPKYTFGSYEIVGMNGHGDTRVQRDGEFVGLNRDNALSFAKDISMGLLDLLSQFVEKDHEKSVAGLELINSLLSSADEASAVARRTESDRTQPQCVFHDDGLVPMTSVTVTMTNGEVRPWWWQCSDPACDGYYDPVSMGYHKRSLSSIPSYGEPFLSPHCTDHSFVMAAVDEADRIVKFKCPKPGCTNGQSIKRRD